MSKKQRYFKKIEEYKDRYRALSTEVIRERLSHGLLIKEAAITYREVLEERDESLLPNNSEGEA